MLRTAGFIFYSELQLLLRRSQEWIYPLAFFIIVISLFPIVFAPNQDIIETFIPGFIWVAALFSSLLSIQTFFQADLEEGCLEQYMISNTSLSLIVFAKIAAHWIVATLSLILIVPFLGLLMGLSLNVILTLFFGLLVGTPMFTLLGVFAVALTLGLRQAGVFLGLLMFPLITPVLIFGITMVHQAHAGFDIVGPLALLAGLSLLAMCLLPFAIATTIRISLDD